MVDYNVLYSAIWGQGGCMAVLERRLPNTVTILDSSTVLLFLMFQKSL